MCLRWLHSTGRKKDNLGKVENLEICSRHFTLDQYKQSVLDRYQLKGLKVPRNVRALKLDAVPTIFLDELRTNCATTSQSALTRAVRVTQRCDNIKKTRYKICSIYKKI